MAMRVCAYSRAALCSESQDETMHAMHNRAEAITHACVVHNSVFDDVLLAGTCCRTKLWCVFVIYLPSGEEVEAMCTISTN